METLLIRNANTDNIKIAAEIIAKGGLVAFPTETVYGLGASALNSESVLNVYKAKGRPADNPLIVHLAKAEDAEKYAHTNELYYKLAKRFMPGPLTVILPKRDIIPYEVSCGLETVALRVPSNEIAHRLIEYSGRPIAAPSANLSGRPSPTAFEHVYEDMNGKIEAIIDGGPCDIGLESTVVTIKDDTVEILRPGKVTYDELKEVAQNVIINSAVKSECTDKKPASPGMKYRHYSPSAPVFLVCGDDEKIIEFFIKKQSQENCGILCFDGDKKRLADKNVLTFGNADDDETQAHLLFDRLRRFDSMDVESIYARIPSDEGVGLAVYNRLIRAAGFGIIDVNNDQE